MKKIFSVMLALTMTFALFSSAAFANTGNLLVNGGFDEEMYGEGNWKFPKSGNWYTEGIAEKSQGEAVTNSGYIYQRVALEKGVTYELTLNIKADSECTPDIQFNDGAEEWPAVNSVKGETITAGTDLKKITVEFEAPNTQDYVISMGTWEEVKVYFDDVTLTEADSYISKLRTGVNGDGVISYIADYTGGEAFIAALYDGNGKLIGCREDKTGSFDAVQDYGTYTVKAFLAGEPMRVKSQEIIYDENSIDNEEHSIGAAKSLTLSKNNMNLYVDGADGVLDAVISPEYAYNKDITWTSSDETVALVSSNGIVTPVSEGTATITAKLPDGTLSDSCTVKVLANNKLFALGMSQQKLTLPEGGAVAALRAIISPPKVVEWKSSNEAVATVNNGVVTSGKPGKATVTAAVEGKSVKCDVTVTEVKNLITNDTFYTDTDGNRIYSQGGGIYKFGNKYYWYGIKYEEAPIYAANPENGKAGNARFDTFTCYSSTDLVNWKNEGDIFSDKPDGWGGRMGVAYNEKTKKYVLISQYSPGTLFAVSDKPEGPFKIDHIKQDAFPIENNVTGDQTIFQDDDGRAYIICSSASGREYLYVIPLRESDFLDIDADNIKMVYHDAEGQYIDENGEIAIKDKKGIEGNCMFKYNGNYYFTGSDLYGWNSSRVYVLRSDEILGDYNADTGLPYIMDDAKDSYAHNSQAGFYVTVHGSEQDLVLYCGDRWADFAGNGIGYNQWIPITMDENGVPHFNDLHQWKLDAEKGTWEVGEGNNYIHNPEFEADRVTVSSPAGWEVYDNVDGTANSNVSGRQYAGNFVWQQSAKEPYTARLKQTITDLPDGTYTLKAWVRSSGGQNICKLYATSGGRELNYSVKTPIDEWTEVVVASDIHVKDGKCEIGLYSDAHANEWVQLDNLSLARNIE